MNDLEAKRIWQTPSEHHSYDQCVACDQYIKQYALREFEHAMRVNAVPEAIREYLRSVVRAHFGAIETDTMLQALKCYPEWMMR